MSMVETRPRTMLGDWDLKLSLFKYCCNGSTGHNTNEVRNVQRKRKGWGRSVYFFLLCNYRVRKNDFKRYVWIYGNPFPLTISQVFVSSCIQLQWVQMSKIPITTSFGNNPVPRIRKQEGNEMPILIFL